MDTEQQQQTLRQIVAELMQRDAGEIASDTRLAGGRMGNSLGRAILDAGIRKKLGRTDINVQSVKTYGELEAAVFGQSGGTSSAPLSTATDSPGIASYSHALPAGISCGIDMEMVESLPEEPDYWQGEFYQHHFTPAEIAYCVTQPEPRPHFAARWCAKEALKKCDARYLASAFTTMEVVVDRAGKPSMRTQAAGGAWIDLPHAVSLTHTPLFASAIVLGGGSPLEATSQHESAHQNESNSRAPSPRPAWPAAGTIANTPRGML